MMSYLSCRPEYKECVLVAFWWAGKRRALYVLRETGSDTLSGALVARHLGEIPMAVCASSFGKHKWDRWVTFARKWQRKTGRALGWMATAAEVALLIEHGAITRATGTQRLLQVQVIHVNATWHISACQLDKLNTFAICFCLTLKEIPLPWILCQSASSSHKGMPDSFLPVRRWPLRS